MFSELDGKQGGLEGIIVLVCVSLALIAGGVIVWREPDCRWDKNLIGTIMGSSLLIGLGVSLFALLVYGSILAQG